MAIFGDIRSKFKRDFNVLYDRTTRYAALRIPAVDDREDVVAETLTHAWEHLESFNGDKGELPGWVIGIARHKVADFWRRRRVDIDDKTLLLRIEAAESGTATETQIDATMTFDALMRSLPQEAKALLTLRHVDGLTHEEIAEIVDKSPEAVRQALSRLHRRLKVQFAEYE